MNEVVSLTDLKPDRNNTEPSIKYLGQSAQDIYREQVVLKEDPGVRKEEEIHRVWATEIVTHETKAFNDLVNAEGLVAFYEKDAAPLLHTPFISTDVSKKCNTVLLPDSNNEGWSNLVLSNRPLIERILF